MNILPECSERKISYSTFTVLDIRSDNSIEIIVYDNPLRVIFYTDKEINILRTIIEKFEVPLYSKYGNFMGDTSQNLGCLEHLTLLFYQRVRSKIGSSCPDMSRTRPGSAGCLRRAESSFKLPNVEMPQGFGPLDVAHQAPCTARFAQERPVSGTRLPGNKTRAMAPCARDVVCRSCAADTYVTSSARILEQERRARSVQPGVKWARNRTNTATGAGNRAALFR